MTQDETKVDGLIMERKFPVHFDSKRRAWFPLLLQKIFLEVSKGKVLWSANTQDFFFWFFFFFFFFTLTFGYFLELEFFFETVPYLLCVLTGISAGLQARRKMAQNFVEGSEFIGHSLPRSLVSSVFFFSPFQGHAHGTWKFPGWGCVIGATAAGLCHSHSHSQSQAGSELSL